MYRLSGKGWWLIVANLLIKHEKELALKLGKILIDEKYDEVGGYRIIL